MEWNTDQEVREYERYLEELEQERWDRDSLARMRDSAFAVSLELRRFLHFSDLVLRKELAGAVPADPWALWKQLRIPSKGRQRLNDAPLSRWLRRTNNFAHFVAQTRRLSRGCLPVQRRVLATQSLLKSWVDEIASFTLSVHTTWQSVTFFYSIESSLATVVYLLSNTNITSHADVLHQFRSLILTPLKGMLFSPIDFAYRRIRDHWTCDSNLPTSSIIEMCPLIVRTAMRGRHGDWITYFHLLYAVSELYRYHSALPFLMTGSAKLRSHDTFIWDLNLALKLWLEVLICTVMGPKPMADIVKVARHQLLKYHKADISSLELRWKLMEEVDFFNLTDGGLSSISHEVFQALQTDPMRIFNE